jgi:hypothetical protein
VRLAGAGEADTACAHWATAGVGLKTMWVMSTAEITVFLGLWRRWWPWRCEPGHHHRQDDADGREELLHRRVVVEQFAVEVPRI